jgi:signal transduction histidine kinase
MMDTQNVIKLEHQAKLLEQKFLSSKHTNKGIRSIVIFMTRSVTIYKTEAFEKNIEKALSQINEAEIEIKKQVPEEDNWTLNTKNNFNSIKLRLYIINNQVDSAEEYLHQLEINDGEITVNDYVGLSQLYARKKDYLKANDYQKKALDLIKTKLKGVENEVEDLLTAFIESEESKVQLLESEQKSKKKTVSILILSFTALIIILLFYLNMRKKDREMKKNIESLNYHTLLQISEMEESKHEMQEIMGRDLHDNVASLLAAIKHNIEFLCQDIQDHKIKSSLQHINLKVEDAYQRARDKSHDLYQNGNQNKEQSFEKRLRQIVDFSLPDAQYEKSILIDNGAVNLLNSDKKIELFKVIQEIITNIIKHAKASKISIVIYEDEDNFNMEIKDNGKGFNTQKKSGLGLSSIRARVEKMAGKIIIKSNPEGTETNITLPGNY